jgi:hypothetical protein
MHTALSAVRSERPAGVCDSPGQSECPSSPRIADSVGFEAAEPGVQRMHGHLAGAE